MIENEDRASPIMEHNVLLPASGSEVRSLNSERITDRDRPGQNRFYAKYTQVEAILISDLKFSHQNQSFICLDRRLNVYGSFFMQ